MPSLLAACIAFACLLPSPARAAAAVELKLAAATAPSSGGRTSWTRIGSIPTGGSSPFRGGSEVWCRTSSGCEIRDGAGHTAALRVAPESARVTFSPTTGASYQAFGPTTTGWTLVLSISKGWESNWFAPLAGN